MVYRIAAIALVILAAATITSAQESFETFHSIVLESSDDPGFGVTLNPPSTGTSYSLTFPASLPTGTSTRRYSFSRAAGSGTGGLSWYATPFGGATQVAFFETDEELIGSSNYTWDNTNQTLNLTSASNQPMLNLTKTASISANESLISIDATYSSSTQKVDLSLFDVTADVSGLGNGSSVTGMDIDVTSGSSSTANPSRATGLNINVTGADTNRAAIIMGGFIGVNTDYPKVYMDIAGDVAFREYNYTAGTLPTGGHNCDFDGNGNQFSFLRIGSSLGGQATLSGIAGGYNGKMLKVYNATTDVIKVDNQSSNSSAANRIKSSANANLLLLPGNTYEFLYSGIEERWLVAFSGPSELAQYGTQEVGPVENEDALPSSIANYLQVSTTEGTNNTAYDLYLDDGTTPGQILVIENLGPQAIKFLGDNIELSTRSSTLADDGAMVLIWSGAQWIQVALAQN